MNKTRNLFPYFWTFPFITFFLGYFIASYLFNIKQLEVPNLIGKNINQAAKILSDSNLNLRILSQKEDSDLPDGIVIDQNPSKKKIKINRPVYLTISKKKNQFPMPNLKGKNLSDAQLFLKENKLKSKIYFLPNIVNKNHCISQSPQEGIAIDQNEKIILYVSSGEKKPIIMPNFKSMNLNEIINFLRLNDVNFDVIVDESEKYDANKNYLILDQRPIAGSILQLSNTVKIQLYVKKI